MARNDEKKKRALIFGAGNNFIYSCHLINRMYCIVGVADNSPQKQGMELFGFRVCRFEEFDRESFDVVIVTPSHSAPIVEQLYGYEGMENRILCLEEAFKAEGEDASDAEEMDGTGIIGNGEKSSDSECFTGNHKKETGTSPPSPKIAVIMYGGMGDFLIGKNWLYYLAAHVGLDRPMIDIYVSGKDLTAAEAVFDDSDLIQGICVTDVSIPELLREEDYDLILRFSIFPMVQRMKEERLASRNQKLYLYASKLKAYGMLHYNAGFFASPDFYKTVGRLFHAQPKKKYHTHFDVLDNLEASDNTLCPVSVKLEEAPYLESVGLKKKKYITINTGMNREYREKVSTRAWELEKWDMLSDMIRQNFPEFKVVQMGTGTAENDDIHADLNLNGVTNLDEAKVLLKNALLHIDYDSGLIHLRHMLSGGASVVLMGPLDVEKHRYPEDIYIRTNVCATACEWTTTDWLSNCPREFNKPVCMASITPGMVFEKVSEYLSLYSPANACE